MGGNDSHLKRWATSHVCPINHHDNKVESEQPGTAWTPEHWNVGAVLRNHLTLWATCSCLYADWFPHVCSRTLAVLRIISDAALCFPPRWPGVLWEGAAHTQRRDKLQKETQPFLIKVLPKPPVPHATPSSAEPRSSIQFDAPQYVFTSKRSRI